MLVEGQQQPRWQRIHDNTDCCLSHWFLAFEKLTLLIIIIIIHMCNEYTHTLGAMGATLRWSFDWEYFMRWVSADSAIIFYGWMHNSIFHDIFFSRSIFVFTSYPRQIHQFARPLMCGPYLIFNTYLKTCVHHSICLLEIWHSRTT